MEEEINTLMQKLGQVPVVICLTTQLTDASLQQEAIEDLKHGALKEEQDESKEKEKRKPFKKDPIFKPELHSEESNPGDESGHSDEDESAGAVKGKRKARPASSVCEDAGSSDQDLFKDRFSRKKSKRDPDDPEADRFHGLPNAFRKKIASDFDEAVLKTVPEDMLTPPGRNDIAYVLTSQTCQHLRSDLLLFMQVLMREDLTKMENILDVCSLPGPLVLSSLIAQGLAIAKQHVQSALCSQHAVGGPLSDHLGESKKTFDRLSIMGKQKFQSWVEKNRMAQETALHACFCHVVGSPGIIHVLLRGSDPPGDSDTQSDNQERAGRGRVVDLESALRKFWRRFR